MCGTCGSTQAGWPERIAPLQPGAAERRARALTALLRSHGRSAACRVAVMTWPGGGVRWKSPDGWCFAPSLSEAIRTLTRRYGPLVPTPGPVSPRPEERGLPFSVTREAAAVWCAAAVEAGWTRLHACTLKLHDRTIVLDAHRAHLHRLPNANPSLRTPYETSELLAHWATALHEFRITA